MKKKDNPEKETRQKQAADQKKEAEPQKAAEQKKSRLKKSFPGPEQTPKIEEHPPERKVFPVVGIGASAGGLEPLEAFFACIPTDKPDMAFVVIQHLSPRHKSIIGEILKKDTDMPIKEIRDGMKILPNAIYFNPPDQEVGLHQGAFQLLEPPHLRAGGRAVGHSPTAGTSGRNHPPGQHLYRL